MERAFLANGQSCELEQFWIVEPFIRHPVSPMIATLRTFLGSEAGTTALPNLAQVAAFGRFDWHTCTSENAALVEAPAILTRDFFLRVLVPLDVATLICSAGQFKPAGITSRACSCDFATDLGTTIVYALDPATRLRISALLVSGINSLWVAANVARAGGSAATAPAVDPRKRADEMAAERMHAEVAVERNTSSLSARVPLTCI